MRVAVGTAVLVALAASAASAQTLTLPPSFNLLEMGTGEYMSGRSTIHLTKDRGSHVSGTGEALFTPGLDRGMVVLREGLPPTRLGVDYQLIGASELGALPTLDMLAIHYIKVQPSKAAAFEKFVADKLNPTVGKLRPDLRLLYYKATSGPAAGSYITIFALTKASRDKYWPGGSDSDDLKAAFTPQIKALATELKTYLAPDSFGVGMTAEGFEAKDWADWAIGTSQKPETKSQK